MLCAAPGCRFTAVYVHMALESLVHQASGPAQKAYYSGGLCTPHQPRGHQCQPGTIAKALLPCWDLPFFRPATCSQLSPSLFVNEGLCSITELSGSPGVLREGNYRCD